MALWVNSGSTISAAQAFTGVLGATSSLRYAARGSVSQGMPKTLIATSGLKFGASGAIVGSSGSSSLKLKISPSFWV